MQVSAAFKTNPDRMEFTWPWDWSEGGFTIYKKHPDSLHWGQPISTLPWGSTSFTDFDANSSTVAEYAFYKKEFEKIEWEVAVQPGQTYVFTINNIYGNGLCCNFGHGWYLLQACSNILNGGAEFGFEKKDTITICTSGNATETLTVAINPDMLTNNTWWKLATLGGQVVDSSGLPGINLAERPKFGYILAGSNQAPVEKRGSLLLVVDDAYSSPLAAEIEQLEQDLWGDGWRVRKIEVNRNDEVNQVKSVIVNEFQQSTDLKMVYLLGHVPVPYSGNFYADGHLESHWGAWPADVFYGEMDGTWTDASVSNTTAAFPRNHNLPGDGKFDQSDIPNAVELAVGRLDLTDMPAFGNDDVELTRRYLRKAHRFKTGQLDVPRRGLVDDNLGIALGAPAASGWRNFAPMFTADSVRSLDYFTTMRNDAYLWSFGGGSGSFTSANGIGSSQDFANDSLRNIFTMLCGSYFGDWDNPDNFLRAPLASAGWTLTSAWAGNPPFTLHRMAMGEPIGQSLQRTQNATETDYYPGPQLVHTALMGDPSLRLHPVKPVENLSAIETVLGVELNWTPPVGEAVAGYHIYRFDAIQNDFLRINSAPVAGTSYLDLVQPLDSALYMVRVLKLEQSGSGTYWNLSLGESAWSSGNPCAGQSEATQLFVEICEGQSYQYNGVTYTVGGIYEHLFPAENGCDSLVELLLTVSVAPIANFSAIICEGEELVVGDSILTLSGHYEIESLNSMGCIQRWSVNLAVEPNFVVNIDSFFTPPIVFGDMTYTTDFSFSFVLTASNGCDSTVNFNFFALVNSDEQALRSEVKVYPNPSGGHFFIETKRPIEHAELEIWDGVGRRVFVQRLHGEQRMELNASHLPPGVYGLKIKDLHGSFTGRLVLVK